MDSPLRIQFAWEWLMLAMATRVETAKACR